MDDEEGGNLLHGSIEAFDEEYDNVLLKFENVQKSIKKTKSFKIFPSVVPILIALPLAYAYFKIEEVYIERQISSSLIVFWVLAWIFLMDLIHLCHWFNYIEIPIIQEEKVEEEQVVPLENDTKVISDNILSGGVFQTKGEHEHYSVKSALTIASHTTSMLVSGFVDRRSSMLPMALDKSSNSMASPRYNRRSSIRPDMALSLMQLKKTGRDSFKRQLVDSQNRSSLLSRSVSVNGSESQESDSILDIIPVNIEYDLPEVFSEGIGMVEQMSVLPEESEDNTQISVLPEESEEIEITKRMSLLPEESEEIEITERMSVLPEESELDHENVKSECQIPIEKVENSFIEGISSNNISEIDIQNKEEINALHPVAKSSSIIDKAASSSNNVSEIHIRDNDELNVSQNVEKLSSRVENSIKSSSKFDMESRPSSDASLPDIPMNNIFSKNAEYSYESSPSYKNLINKADRIADTGENEELPKKSSKRIFNFLRRRTTHRQIEYDPYEDTTIAIRRTSQRKSAYDDPFLLANENSSVHQSTSKIESEEEFELLWSPLFFQMIWKFLFRWIVTPLFVYFVDSSVMITLIVYPFLVIPGYFSLVTMNSSLVAHMFTVTLWIYPVIVRFLTSLITVFMTEMINQFMFYSMIAPLAFIDIRFNSADDDVEINIVKGVVKAIIFFLSRNIVKYMVIYTDRRAIQHERETNLKTKKSKEEKSDEAKKSKEKLSEIKEPSSGVQVVFEDELEDLTYYGQLILGLGGHGVPGWIFIFRIKDHLQFGFAAAGSLVMEALMVVGFKNFMDWLEKRKERKKKAEEKEKRKQVKKASKLSKGFSRKGSITPNMAAIKGSKATDKDKKSRPSNRQSQKVVPDMTSRPASRQSQKAVPDMYSRKSNSSNAAQLAPMNPLRKDSSKTSILPESNKEAMAMFAITAFHQDNRRQAVERRFYMCSTYAAIIGAATIYMIFSTGDGHQELCNYYGNVSLTVVAWRLFAVLSVQFLVDWWFTLNQLIWGLPFGFTTQIETTIVQGFLVTSLAILQSLTVLMAHERGLFGTCQVTL